MATDNKKTNSLGHKADDEPTLEFEIPAVLGHAADLPAPEIELDENTYDIDEHRDVSANLSKSELKSTVRAQAERIDELEYQLEQLKGRHRGLSEELKAREEIAGSINDEASRAIEAMRKAEAAIRERNAEHATLKSALDRTSERASALDDENRELQERLTISLEQAENLKNQLNDHNRTIRQLDADLRAARHGSESRASNDKEANLRIAELNQQLHSARAGLADLRNYVDQREAKWDARDARPGTIGPQDGVSAEQAKKVEELTAEIAVIKARLVETRQKFKKKKQEASELRVENRKLSRALEYEADSELHSTKGLPARQHGEITELRREAKRLERDNQRLESYADSLRMQLQDRISIVKASVAIRAKLEKGLEIATGRIREMSLELEHARTEVEALRTENQNIQAEHEREIRQMRFDLGAAQETLADQETINEQLASDLANHESYKKALETQLDESAQQSSQSIQDLMVKLESARRDADEFERKLRMKDAAISDLMKEISEASNNTALGPEIDNALHRIDDLKPGVSPNQPRKHKKDKLTRLLIGNADGRELRFPLFKDRLTIGRTSHNDVQLNMQYISRRHAVIATDHGRSRVIDWGSKNGVYVNKVRITEKVLENGDIVTIGTTDFRYEERPKR